MDDRRGPRDAYPRRANTSGITVEVGHRDDDVDSGRSWRVSLCRGSRSVVIGEDLGRITATVLARELRTLLHPRTRQEGDAID